MAHHTIRPAYFRLADRLNRFPQGAPTAETLYRILALLFTEREAELVSVLPIRPFTATQAAARWKMEENAARDILDELAGRAVLLDLEKDEKKTYLLPPPMAGFFEFSLMRLGGNPDQKALAELYYQYLNVEEDFVRDLFANGETQMGRAFVQERALSEENALHVLDYERASGVIRDSWAMSIGACYCRHKMMHVGRACDAPLDICMTFNTAADSLARHGYARKVEKEEGLDLLRKAWELNLVQFGENVREGVSFICNCCGCCCEAMIAARRFGFMHPVHPSNFLPVVDTAACTGCGKCVEACPVEALALASANDPRNPRRKQARLDAGACLGCGVCTRVCPGASIRLEPRQRQAITPRDSVHRIALMALERGKLPDLLFDNRTLLSHRAMAAILGAILRFPPVKRALAGEQVKSRYLEALMRRNPV